MMISSREEKPKKLKVKINSHMQEKCDYYTNHMEELVSSSDEEVKSSRVRLINGGSLNDQAQKLQH